MLTTSLRIDFFLGQSFIDGHFYLFVRLRYITDQPTIDENLLATDIDFAITNY